MYRVIVTYQLQKEKLRAWEKGTTDGRGPFGGSRAKGAGITVVWLMKKCPGWETALWVLPLLVASLFPKNLR